MLKYYVKRSNGEQFQPVETPPPAHVWVRGEQVTEKELTLLAERYTLNANILRDVLDRNELPRIETREDGLYVFVRSVARGKHGKITTTPVLLALKGTIFASLTPSDVNVYNHATSGVVVPLHRTPSLMLDTFAAIVSEYEELMQHTSHSIHDTAQRLRSHEVTNDDFIRFVTVEDNLTEYKMNLEGMLVVAERLKETFSTNGDAEAVEDIRLYIRQLLVAIASYNQSIMSIRNAYGTIANNVLNQRMKTLTVLTLLVALPNVFYGMYGMNIALPFAEEPWAYGAILLLTLVIVVMVVLIAKRRNIF
jgi:magnesium transporter